MTTPIVHTEYIKSTVKIHLQYTYHVFFIQLQLGYVVIIEGIKVLIGLEHSQFGVIVSLAIRKDISLTTFTSLLIQSINQTVKQTTQEYTNNLLIKVMQ